MTLDQARAKLAHQHVSDIASSSNDDQRKRYATVVHELTTLMCSSGTVQALEVVAAYTHAGKREQGARLLDQLGAQLGRVSKEIKDGDSLRSKVRTTEELRQYMHISRELLATLVWYRRCIQSILKIDATAAASEYGDD